MNQSQIIVVPAEMTFLKPILIPDLARIGRANDGGYVIPRSLIDSTDGLVSLGVSDDWSFEKNFKELNPNVIVHSYDHTVSNVHFFINMISSLLKFCLGRNGFQNIKTSIFNLFDFMNFFRGSNRHFKERVFSRIDNINDATPEIIMSRLKCQNIFIKMDIEGSEYRVLKDFLKYKENIVGLVVEFHDTEPLRPVFIETLKAILEDYWIVHFHENNAVGLPEDGFPEVVEITFLRRDLVDLDSPKYRYEFPIPGLDQPNLRMSPSHFFQFE